MLIFRINENNNKVRSTKTLISNLINDHNAELSKTRNCNKKTKLVENISILVTKRLQRI